MKKKMPKNVFFFTDEIYCQEFMIILTPSHAKFRKILKEFLNIDIEEDDGCTGQFNGIQNKKKGDLAIIWSQDKKINLLHECFHACSWVMRNRDIMMDSESSEESWAYYLSYIYRTIHERINDSER